MFVDWTEFGVWTFAPHSKRCVYQLTEMTREAGLTRDRMDSACGHWGKAKRRFLLVTTVDLYSSKGGT